ncbi:pyridoxal phosphate-dependent aminotransferase [Desulfovibrio sp. OttesenSCG-928-G15]|nr:pyridoxal phosphate-dependent aminotransferase [Desulfovibrio sp. OttesenSCG-928-G15]
MPIHDFDRILDRRGGDSIKWNLYPENVLPMWVAESDFTAPEPIVTALQKRVAEGVYGYSDPLDKEFQQAVTHWMRSRFSFEAKDEWVCFSPGVVITLMLCVLAYTKEGDNVVFLTPTYGPFYNLPKAHGRTPLGSPLLREGPGQYTIDFADLEAKLAKKNSTLMFLCNPHNPTGKVFCHADLMRIGELCLKHGVLVVSDEVHSDYVHPGKQHVPFSGLSDAIAQNSLMAMNPSKTFNIADLQCSAVISANSDLLAQFKAMVQRHFLSSNTLGKIALKTAYRECAWYADQVAAYVKGNIDMAVAFINERVGKISAYAPESTYLLWLDCREMGLAQKDLEDFFMQKARIALNSGTNFGEEGTGFMRMNLACPRATVQEAMNRLEKASRA